MRLLTSLLFVLFSCAIFLVTYDSAYADHPSNNLCTISGACHAILQKEIPNYGNQYNVVVADQFIDEPRCNINFKAVATQWVRFENGDWIETGYTVGGINDVDGDGIGDECLMVETPYYAYNIDNEYQDEKFADVSVTIGEEQFFEISNKDKNLSYDLYWKNDISNIHILQSVLFQQADLIDIGLESNILTEYVSIEDTHFSNIQYYDNTWNSWNGISVSENISATHSEPGPTGPTVTELWSIDNCDNSYHHFHAATKLGAQCEPPTEISLPSWVEESADKWSTNRIMDSEYLNSVNFTIAKSVISIPNDQSCSSSEPTIPSWIKDRAGWWVDGTISDQHYADGLAFMVKECIIILDQYTNITAQSTSQTSNSIIPVSQTIEDYSIIPVAFGLEDNNNDSNNNNSNIVLTSHTAGNTITMATNYITPACEPDCFMPSVETIGVGDSVTFVNSKSSVTVIASGDPFGGTDGVFNTGDIEPGQSKTISFAQEGIYNYFDLIAPWMQGTIIVDDAPPTANLPPTADAGDPQTKDEGDIVVLSGSGSSDPENAVLRYSWKQISGPLVQLSGSNFLGGVSNGQGTNFIAPEVTASEVLVFELTVKDDLLQPDTAMVSITVNDVVETVNNIPVANAGADQPSVDENTLVTLDASASFDPDFDDSITYE